MLIIMTLVFTLVGGLVLSVALPLIAFLAAGQGFGGIAAAFTPEGWQRAMDYIFHGTYWDRWYIIAAIGLFVVLWVIAFLALFYKHRVGLAFLSFIGLALALVVAYIYAAWPNPEEFATWHRVLIYIQLGSAALSPLFNLFRRQR